MAFGRFIASGIDAASTAVYDNHMNNAATNTVTNTIPTITVRFIIQRDGYPGYIASGPDGHEDLLLRTTEDAARRDGLAYFLKYYVESGGRWIVRR